MQKPPRARCEFYDHFEQERLDSDNRGYLLYLEQTGILSPAQRELVI